MAKRKAKKQWYRVIGAVNRALVYADCPNSARLIAERSGVVSCIDFMGVAEIGPTLPEVVRI